MRLTPDYSESAFVPVPAGVYKVRILKAEYDAGKEFNGNPPVPRIAWELETFGSPQKAHNNRKIWHRTPTSGQFSGVLAQFVRAIDPEYNLGELDTDNFIGKEVEVEIEYPKKKDGSIMEYPQVKKVLPSSGNASLDDITF